MLGESSHLIWVPCWVSLPLPERVVADFPGDAHCHDKDVLALDGLGLGFPLVLVHGGVAVGHHDGNVGHLADEEQVEAGA